jgi:hypothetical protein
MMLGLREAAAIRGPLKRSFSKGHADRMKESRRRGTLSGKNQILSERERLDLNLVIEPERVVVKKIGDGCSLVAGQIARFPA